MVCPKLDSHLYKLKRWTKGCTLVPIWQLAAQRGDSIGEVAQCSKKIDNWGVPPLSPPPKKKKKLTLTYKHSQIWANQPPSQIWEKKALIRILVIIWEKRSKK
jgi:hypothetical protein